MKKKIITKGKYNTFEGKEQILEKNYINIKLIILLN